MPALVHTKPDHDETLIARLAAGDVDEHEAADARALVAACPACAELRSDVESIMAATAHLPAPTRTRDFRLTDADAARLRRTGWRRLLARFGDPRLTFTKPLATGLVTLGIAGLVLANSPSLSAGFGAAGAAPQANPVSGAYDTGQATAGPVQLLPGGTNGAGDNATASNRTTDASGPPRPAASAAASIAPSLTAAPPEAGATAAPASAPADVGVGGGTTASAGSPVPPFLESNPGVGKSTSAGTDGEGPSGLALASCALVLVGVILFALRWAARRAS